MLSWGGDENEQQSSQAFYDALSISRRFFTAYSFTLGYLLPLLATWFFYVNIIFRMWQRRVQLWSTRKSYRRTTTKVSQSTT